MKHLRITLPILALTVALFLGLSAAAYAQEITGNIAGTVRDSSGASVNGATVTITDQDKNIVVRTVTTGEDGTFSAPQLPSGNYSITIEAPSFKKSIQTGIKLDVNQRREVEVTLEA